MRIGPLEFSTPFCQAGLAGYSDRAMRLVARRRGCPYAVTEALLDVILLNGGLGLKKSIDINDEDHPTAGQIMGSEPGNMARAAVIMAEAGYDVVDLNFACPVKKIKNKARGGHMLLDVERGLSILKAVRDALPPEVPTTISLRRGFDDSAESEERFFQIVETAWENGYSAVRVHGRTVEQKYQGRAKWPFLVDLKRRYPGRTILGSGDVFTANDAVRMIRETGVDLVWIARGAIGNPWIFRHAAKLMSSLPPPRNSGGEAVLQTREIAEITQDPPAVTLSPGAPRDTAPEIAPPSIDEQREALAEHFAIAMEIHGEQLAGRRMRKMGIKYSRFHPSGPEVKTDFISIRGLREWAAVLDKWYSGGGPGVWPDPESADEVNDGGAPNLQSCEIA